MDKRGKEETGGGELGRAEGRAASVCTNTASITPPRPEVVPRIEQAAFKFQIGLRGLTACLGCKNRNIDTYEARVCHPQGLCF